MKKANKISKEIKEQILKRIKEDGISVTQVAEEHGIHVQTIYRWLTNGLTKPPSWQEFNKLKKENKELMSLVGEITIEMSKIKKKS